MATNINTTYSGDLLGNFLSVIVLDLFPVTTGGIHVLEGTTGTMVLPKLAMSTNPQAPADSYISTGDLDYGDMSKKLEHLVFWESISTYVFEHVWRQYQPKGNLVFEELPIDVQFQISQAFIEAVRNSINRQIVKGDSSGADFIDGFYTLAKASTGATEVTKITSTTVTSANAIEEVGKIYASMPRPAFKDPARKSRMKIYLSSNFYEAYGDAIRGQVYKNMSVMEDGNLAYKGIPVIEELFLDDNEGYMLIGSDGPLDTMGKMVATVKMGTNLLSDDALTTTGQMANGGDAIWIKSEFSSALAIHDHKSFIYYGATV